LDAQPTELVQRVDGCFDDSAVLAEAGAVLGSATPDDRLDPALTLFETRPNPDDRGMPQDFILRR